MDDKNSEKQDKKIIEEQNIDLTDPTNLFDLIYNAKEINDPKSKIINHLENLVSKSSLKEKYNLLFIYDDTGSITRYTSNQIYAALSERKEDKKDILLILYSLGGHVEPAYLIAKCCKEYSKNKFIVAMPRHAKSAATLIAIGADEIHMGSMSEMGPIDPQIRKYPALGLGNAVEYLAGLSKKYPESSNMFAKYLSLSLDLRDLGYFERVAVSAVQYAERLLQSKKLPNGENPYAVATRFVYFYKDHSFVIDREEAESFLGKDLIKYNTDEYRFSDTLHKFLEMVTLAYRVFKGHDFKITGHIDSGISFIKRKED